MNLKDGFDVKVSFRTQKKKIKLQIYVYIIFNQMHLPQKYVLS